MSTRSFIGIHNADDSITGIYCHQLGSPRHNGQTLLSHYDSEAKLTELFAKGSLSILGETPDTCTLAPHYSHKGIQTTTLLTWADDIQADLDYIYFFEKNTRVWKCLDTDTGIIAPLTLAVYYDEKVNK